MGLIIVDEIEFPNGLSVGGTYLSFAGNNVSIIPGPSARLAAALDGGAQYRKSNGYTLCGKYSIWPTKAAQQAGKEPITSNTIDCFVLTPDMNAPLHDMLYDYIKTNIYTNTTDA